MRKNRKQLFGGPFLGQANARSKRLISTKKTMSLIFFAKSNLNLKERNKRFSFLINQKRIRIVHSTLKGQAKKSGIKISHIQLSSHNIYIRFRCTHRKQLNSFTRACSGILVRKILGSEKGRPLEGGKKRKLQFWRHRPLTGLIKDNNWISHLCKIHRALSEFDSNLAVLSQKNWGFIFAHQLAWGQPSG